MRNCIRGLSALVALLIAGAPPAFADTSLTTPPNTTNEYGQPVRATVSLKVKTDRVLVLLTNETSNITDFDQTITAISFKLPAKMKAAHMGASSATPRVVTAGGFHDSTPDDTRWNVILDGDIVTIKAPGQRFSILPDARKNYPKADASILDPRHNPFLTKTVIMEIVFPESGLTDQLTDIKIYWGHEPDILNTVAGLSDPVAGYEPSDPPIEITGGTLPPGGGGGGDGYVYIIPTGYGGSTGGNGGPASHDPGNPLTPAPTGGETDPPIITPTSPPENPPDPPTDPLIPPVLPNTPPTVPEPATLSILALGALGLLTRRRE